MPVFPTRAEPFEGFVAPARARPELWRLIAGTALAAAVWVALTALALPLVVRFADPGGRVALIGFLASFAALILGLALAARLLHRRGIGSLFGPGGLRWRDFALGVGAVALLASLGALPLFAFGLPRPQAGLAEWAAWLPLALPAILLQMGAEELAFRGYLMQGLAARFRARALWWVLPAVLFGLLHWSPAEFGPNAALAVLNAVLIGLILGDVTARTGNLSLAMGLHFANNTIALLLVAIPSPLSALSLYLAPVAATDTAALRLLLLIDLAGTARRLRRLAGLLRPVPPAIAFGGAGFYLVGYRPGAGPRMNWISNYVRPKINSLFSRREVPENLWVKCDECGTMLFHRELADALQVCTNCGHHMAISPRERFRALFDGGVYRRGQGAEAAWPTRSASKTRRNIPTGCARRARRPARRRRCWSPRARSAG